MNHIHIGHHFFGAGNLGDDLMLAGFLGAVPGGVSGTRFTCCIPWDRESMGLRFPAVEWLPYDSADRARCIAECDAWLGLGDTPFQTSVGDWMLDHLLQEAQLCAGSRKRMVYLCVGVNDVAAARHAKTASLVRQAAHIWTRDAASAVMLGEAVPESRLTIGSDLAHLWLSRQRFADPTPGEIGIVLNFENSAQYTVAALDRLMASLAARFQPRWLAQEVRLLTASECSLHPQLDARVRGSVPLVMPDYANAASAQELLAAWGVPEFMLTSRYHAALIGAWMGSRVAVFPRSEKVRSAMTELRLAGIADMTDAAAAAASAIAAEPVSQVLLQEHAALAQRCCDEAWHAILAMPE